MLQEAALCGVPSVVADVGSLRRTMVPSDEYGRMYSVGDTHALLAQLLGLLGNADDRRTIGDNAMKRAHRLFSRERMCQQYTNLFYDLAADVSNAAAS